MIKNTQHVPDWDEWRGFIIRHAPELGLSVSELQARRFGIHAEELLRWNKKINLTAITAPLDIAAKHFLDALAPAPYIPDHSALLDMGTGGGFPGLPLKVLKPSLCLTLVDATLKKINFVNQVIRSAGLDNARAVHCRAESLNKDPRFAAGFDTVICRAFDTLADFVRLARGLIRQDGRLIAMKGRQIDDELEQLEKLALDPDDRRITFEQLFSIDVHHYTLPVLGDRRSLVIMTAKPYEL
jgi:16S rRNA (guanine527-N7)-methyltransferase